MISIRKLDAKKTRFEMAAKTINFEKFVLEDLEDLAKKQGTTVSRIVNWYIRDIVIKPERYYREKAKHHQREAMRMVHIAEDIELKKELK